MNMLLHGVENPDIRYRDSLAQDHAGEEEKYTLVLANPAVCRLARSTKTAKDLLQIVKTKKTELLFLALFLRLLKPGGRAAVIVPDGVLFGSSKAHKTLPQILVEEQKLDAVISLPGRRLQAYAGVSTAILLFTKTNSGGTDHVWFYDMEPTATRSTTSAPPCPTNNLPDILAAGEPRDGADRAHRPKLLRPKADIVANDYDLSINRYKEVVHDEVEHRPPTEILRPLANLEAEIEQGREGVGGDAEVKNEVVGTGWRAVTLLMSEMELTIRLHIRLTVSHLSLQKILNRAELTLLESGISRSRTTYRSVGVQR